MLQVVSALDLISMELQDKVMLSHGKSQALPGEIRDNRG